MDVREIRLLDLVPSRNARLDMGDLDELSESIREHGLLQPIRVRPVADGKYQIIAGHRRVAAAKALGLPSIPAAVAEESDTGVAVQNVVENLQRENLRPLELVRGVRELQSSFGLSPDEIARSLSKPASRIRTYLRASHLPESVLQRLESGEGGTHEVKGLTLRHIERLIGDLPTDSSADAGPEAQRAANSVTEILDELDRRGARLNAHMADAVGRDVRAGRLTVSQAIDHVLANPDDYRYSRSYGGPGELEADTWSAYRSIHRQIAALASRLRPEIAVAYSESQKADLLVSLGAIAEALQKYEAALRYAPVPNERSRELTAPRRD